MFKTVTVLILLLIPSLTSAAQPEPYWLNSSLNNRDLTISPEGDLLFTSVMTPDNRSKRPRPDRPRAGVGTHRQLF